MSDPDAVSPTPEDDQHVVAMRTRPTTQRPVGVAPNAAWRLTSAVDQVARALDRLVGDGARWARLTPGLRVAVGYLVTRLIVLALLAVPETVVLGDPIYYAHNLEKLGTGTDLMSVLHEYPLPAVALVGLPWLLSFGSVWAYVCLFIVLLMAIDIAFLRLLFRFGGRRQTAAVTLWLAAGPMMGPLALTRFDLVPGVLAGAAVLILATRPRLAAVLIACGAAIKLWPVVLLPALASPLRTRGRVLAMAAVTGAVIVIAIVAVDGVDRLLSPLGWQSDRGLHVESLAALPLMAAWSLAHGPWSVRFTEFAACEIQGPGDHVVIVLANVAAGAATLLVAALWVRAWRRGGSVGAGTVGWLMLTAAGLLILTNKVFSPQYLLWISPIAIAMVAIAPRGDTGVRRFAVLVLAVGALTQVLYPLLYPLITTDVWANPLGVLLLAIRDLALMACVVYAGRRAWTETSRPVRETTTDGRDLPDGPQVVINRSE